MDTGQSWTADTTATTNSPVGSYAIHSTAITDQAFLANYDVSYVDGTMTITKAKATPVVGTVYDSLTYGTTLGDATNPTMVRDTNGNAVPGNFDYTDGTNDVTDTVLNIGHHDLTVTFNPTDTADYNSVITTASIDITKAKIAIVADSYEKTYGNANLTLTDTIYADLGPATGTDPTTGKDYSTETDPITGKPYEVYTKLDSTDLASVAYTNALGGAAAASTDADLLANAGHHVINPTQISDGGAGTASHEFLNNFDVTYGGGTLTVDKATLTVTADAQSKIYGDTVTFAGTEFTADGLVNSDSVSRVTLTSDGAATTAHVSGSPYAIVASDAEGSGLDNYTISYDVGHLTVAPKALTVKADANQSKVYGTNNPPLTGTIVSSLVTDNGNNDTAESIGLTFSSAAVKSSHVGTYAINAAVVDTDYAVALASGSGTLAVTPARLTVTANNATMVLGGPLPPFSAYYVGLVNGDSVSKLGGPLKFIPGDTSKVGTTTISLGDNLTDPDYTIEYRPGTLTVKAPAKPIIIGLPPSKKK